MSSSASPIRDSAASPMPWPEHLFPYRSRFWEGARHTIHYVDEGSGPVLLFVHPAPATSFMYREFLGALREDFRVVALDYPGFGLSTVPERVSLPALARSVADFIVARDLHDVTLVVHDTGGAVGLGAAALVPERCRAFVVSDAVGFPLDDFLSVRIALRVVTSAPFRAANRRWNLLTRIVARFGPGQRRLPPDVRAVYRALFPTHASRDRMIELLRELLDRSDWLVQVETDVRSKFADRPALIMFGKRDPAKLVGFPARYREMFPNHHVRDVPGEAHFPHEGSPGFMIEAIREWWKTQVERV